MECGSKLPHSKTSPPRSSQTCDANVRISGLRLEPVEVFDQGLSVGLMVTIVRDRVLAGVPGAEETAVMEELLVEVNRDFQVLAGERKHRQDPVEPLSRKIPIPRLYASKIRRYRPVIAVEKNASTPRSNASII